MSNELKTITDFLSPSDLMAVLDKGVDIPIIQENGEIKEWQQKYPGFSGLIDFKYENKGGYFTFGDFKYTLEDSFGGSGEGDDYWMVIKVEKISTKEMRYYKFYGYYASHDGGYLDESCFVIPKEKTIIVWENA